MARKLLIAALCLSIVAAALLSLVVGAYFAAREVRPFYEQAMLVAPAVLEQGGRELESRATALYSDANQIGQWQALFTVQQINGWLATRSAENHADSLPRSVRDPRVAIAPEMLTIGFRTSLRGIETVVSVDASVFLTDDGEVAIRLVSMQAGALSLPVMRAADDLAAACRELHLPVRWTQEAGQPIAVVDLCSRSTSEKRQLTIDSIELGDSELYVAGHTRSHGDKIEAEEKGELGDFEVRVGTRDSGAVLEIATRPEAKASEESPAADR